MALRGVGGSGGSGTVTATGGALTANAVVLGAGTTDTKVSTGIVTDGVGKLTLTPAANTSALVVASHTHTTSNPAIDVAQTWNDAGVTFTAAKINATSTASAAASLLLDLQVAGTSKLNVKKDGSLNWSVGGLDYGVSTASTFTFTISGGYKFAVNSGGPSSAQYLFASFAGGTTDLWLTRSVAAVLQQGNSNAASPVAQTLQAQGSRSGTDTNVGGANYTIASGNGTGTGTISSLILQSPVAVGSGTDAQTMTTGLTIKSGTAVRPSYTVAALPAAATAGAGAMAWVTDANATTFLSTVAGGGANKVPVSSDGTNWVIG